MTSARGELSGVDAAGRRPYQQNQLSETPIGGIFPALALEASA